MLRRCGGRFRRCRRHRPRPCSGCCPSLARTKQSKSQTFIQSYAEQSYHMPLTCIALYTSYLQASARRMSSASCLQICGSAGRSRAVCWQNRGELWRWDRCPSGDAATVPHLSRASIATTLLLKPSEVKPCCGPPQSPDACVQQPCGQERNALIRV